MKTVDLHPEELLDRARRRELTLAEATRLRDHALECAACALELAWCSDGLHERSPSEEDALRAQRSVRRACAETSGSTPLTALVAPRKSRWAVGSAPMLALAVLLSASAAAAAIGDSGVRWIVEHVASIVSVSSMRSTPVEHARRPSRSHATPPRSDATMERPTRDDSSPAIAPAAPRRDDVASETQASTESSQLQATARNRVSRVGRRARSGSLGLEAGRDQGRSAAPLPQTAEATRGDPAPRSAGDNASPAAAPLARTDSASPAAAPLARADNASPTVEPAPRTASDPATALLREAQAARAAGDAARALALYARLAEDFSGSRAERSSRVSRGRLLLEHRRDAPAALELFDRYLDADAGGTLAEEARLGRAQALEQLGDRNRVAAAWRELLQKHPRSIHASYARTRLRELER